MLTIFKNIRETSTPFHRSIDFSLKRIKEGSSKDIVEEIRAEEDKEARNILKKKLPAVCFSGRFTRRADDAIIEHSGFICLDFDDYECEQDMIDEKIKIIESPFVYSCFISPSGRGLKVIVRIPKDIQEHKRYFNSLRDYFDSEHFDTTSKNISRVCYESYDDDLYINTESKLWDKKSEHEYRPVDKKTDKATVPITDENKIVEILMKWWTKKYGLVDGERNNNVYILAAAFNDYGVNKTLAEYIIGQMEQSDFTKSEIAQTINSAYSNKANFGTKYYEDEAVMSKIKRELNRGKSPKDIKKEMPNLPVEEDVFDEVLVDASKESNVRKFWEKNDKGVIKIIHYLFKDFLQEYGFYKYAPHNSDKYIFVRVTNNLIDRANEEQIKDFVLKYLEKFDDLSIYNYFADKTRFFKEDFLSLLDTVRVHFVKDTKDFSYIYFNNCALKVTVDDIVKVDYVDLNGYVWRDQVIDRDFEFCDSSDCDFKKFIHNISGNEDARIDSLESTIGFLMSGYKDPSYCPAVILNDEVITDNPEGGTGKGLFVQAVGQTKKVVDLNGKLFKFDSQFGMQTISTDTQVVSFDDVKRGFNFENLFSTITEGITIEKKNKDAIKVPFSESPKIVITTNYAIKGKGNSFERRKWELEFRKHYSKEFTPVDDFGKRFFDEWDEDEWCAFDNYMINNLQFYLNSGLVESEFKNLEIRKLASETCHEFIEWCGIIEGVMGSDEISFNKRLFKDKLYLSFIKDNPDFAPKAKRTISRIAFYKWLNAYGNFFSDVQVIENRSSEGRWIEFRTIEQETEDNGELQF